jgi:ribose transport system substrate-binding protein
MSKLTSTAAVALALALSAGSASADTSGKKIALSNNYAGNSWRQAMLRSWDKVTKPAVAAGVVAAADPFTTAENQVTEQAA